MPRGAVERPGTGELEQLIGVASGNGRPSAPAQHVLAAARARARVVAEALGDSDRSGTLTSVVFAADTIAGIWLDRRWDVDSIDDVVAKLADRVGADRTLVRFSVFARAIRERHLFEIPPQLAIETQLEMVTAFSPVEEASLWTPPGARPSARAIPAGKSAASRRARSLARAAIESGTPVIRERSLYHAFPVRRWDEPYAALVVRIRHDGRSSALAYAQETALAIAPHVEMDALLARNADRERSLVEAGERRLVRVGFDLHDGPMQDVAALAQDLRHFRAQLEEFLKESDRLSIALGRLDDFEARVVALDSDLREIARSLQTPTALRLPLSDLLEREIESFRRKSGLPVRFKRGGDLEGLTSSQKIALLRVVQEALANVHEHSSAARVDVRIAGSRAQLAAEVMDDGVGFAVDRRLLEAAQAGHLGLVGMSERVRLLGGRLDIESRPGGPTRIRVSIPRWTPVAGREEPAAD